ncbi:MAG TPA: flavodoxin domain-containing protein [Actinopolymorphaceae bacterium]|nr:flavodoxin domain-containing protein [Actinopolymorphaceae bacterium]
MSTALVVYESMFGNTAAIAKAVAAGLAATTSVDIVEVADAPTHLDEQVRLLVVGGPTHVFGMSRPSTRRSAAEQSAGRDVQTRLGIREWLDELDATSTQIAFATFDTKVKKPLVAGSAARSAARRLRRLGFRRACRPTNFYVTATTGPLASGETERATRWGGTLAAELG